MLRPYYRLSLHFVVRCPPEQLMVPAPAAPLRADNLWQHTCFELFVRGETREYCEFNFSPSGQWAAYRFDDYRTPLEKLELDDKPDIGAWGETSFSAYTVLLEVPDDYQGRVGLSAVTEERGGQKSYWALAHPDPDKPDFHHPACFTLELPPPPAP